MNNIIETRKIAIESDRSIAPFKGMNNEINNNSVSRTTICAIVLFSFFKPEFKINKIIPKQTGISAVGDPSVKEQKYG